jgi:hypothetical protein
MARLPMLFVIDASIDRPRALKMPPRSQNKTLEPSRLQGFGRLPIAGSAHFFLAEDLEPPLDELFEPDFEPPFAPPDFFAAVAMLVVLKAPVILRREDDRTRLLNRNLIRKRPGHYSEESFGLP